MITVRLTSMFVTRVDSPDVLCERTHLTLVILLTESRNLNQITEKMTEKSLFSINKILDPWDYGMGVRGKKWKEGESEIKEHIPPKI